MSNARTATCPHCKTEQAVANWSQRACTQCGRTFYPAPSVDPVVQRKRTTRRALRERDEAASRDPISFYWAFCFIGGFLVLILCAQLYFEAVFFSPKRGPSTVILRLEEPRRYWEWVMWTATGATAFLTVGIVGLRRIRARLARLYPEDEA